MIQQLLWWNASRLQYQSCRRENQSVATAVPTACFKRDLKASTKYNFISGCLVVSNLNVNVNVRCGPCMSGWQQLFTPCGSSYNAVGDSLIITRSNNKQLLFTSDLHQ
jgi:hypothetical protein